MQVIVQPRDGIEPLLKGISEARESIDIIVYRLDRLEIELALAAAARRGVRVHALVTYTNREDLKQIKKLESRLIDCGVKVTQTAEDLVRYHSKMMIIDRRIVYLLTFNFTFLDIHHSRSFGLVSDEPHLVDEAIRLFEADTAGSSRKINFEHFVISPINARQKLSEFIDGARERLLIYDGKLTDAQMIRHLENRVRAGVDIRVIGGMDKRIKGIKVRKMPLIRLHVQAIIRDNQALFIGSQSLRKVELDERREVGLITSDPEAVNSLYLFFVMDWGDLIE